MKYLLLIGWAVALMGCVDPLREQQAANAKAFEAEMEQERQQQHSIAEQLRSEGFDYLDAAMLSRTTPPELRDDLIAQKRKDREKLGAQHTEVGQYLQKLDAAREAARQRGSGNFSEEERVARIRKATEIDELNGLCARGKGEPEIGMTEDQVVATSWCIGGKSNDTITAGHVRRQWVYDGWVMQHGHKGYLYFEDGYLTAIQSRS